MLQAAAVAGTAAQLVLCPAGVIRVNLDLDLLLLESIAVAFLRSEHGCWLKADRVLPKTLSQQPASSLLLAGRCPSTYKLPPRACCCARRAFEIHLQTGVEGIMSVKMG